MPAVYQNKITNFRHTPGDDVNVKSFTVALPNMQAAPGGEDQHIIIDNKGAIR